MEARSLLSDREVEILRLLVNSAASDKEIAQSLGIAAQTVKAHLRAMRRKLHLGNRVQVAVWGVQNGFKERSE
jgi:two-component system, NarL family, nitrate/nitrite response regulator NarL